MRGARVAAAFALVALLPAASALTLSAGREGELFVVSVTASDEAVSIDIIVEHQGDDGPTVDRVVPVDLRPNETRRIEIEGLPTSVPYDVRAAPRGEVEAPPAPEPEPTVTEHATPLPSLMSLAQGGVVTTAVRPAFSGAMDGRLGTVFAPDMETVMMVRENVQGALEAVLSHDGGVTFGAVMTLSSPAREPGGVRVHWDETRFADGTLGVAFRQEEYLDTGDDRHWTLVRIDPDLDAVVDVATMPFDRTRFVENDRLMEVYTLPNERTLFVAETKDVSGSYSIDDPSALRIWTMSQRGELSDELEIPLAHGISPSFQVASTVDGTLRIAWTYYTTTGIPDAAQVWTTTSKDGGRTFSKPAPTRLPFGGAARVGLEDADIDPDGTLHAIVLATDPYPDVPLAPYYVRIPLDGAASNLDLRKLPTPAYGPDEFQMPHVVAAGDHVFVSWFDEEMYIAESLDAGLTWGPIMRLRSHDMSSFHASQMTARPDGRPLFAINSARCMSCVGALFVEMPDMLELIPGGTEWMTPPTLWIDGGELVASEPYPPYHERPPLTEPTMETPGAPIMALILAVAAVAWMQRRR